MYVTMSDNGFGLTYICIGIKYKWKLFNRQENPFQIPTKEFLLHFRAEHSVLSWCWCCCYVHLSIKASLPTDSSPSSPWEEYGCKVFPVMDVVNWEGKNHPWKWNKGEGVDTGYGVSIFKRTSANLSPITKTSTADTFLSGASELTALFRLLRRLLQLICSSEILQKPLACISLRPLIS